MGSNVSFTARLVETGNFFSFLLGLTQKMHSIRVNTLTDIRTVSVQHHTLLVYEGNQSQIVAKSMTAIVKRI